MHIGALLLAALPALGATLGATLRGRLVENSYLNLSSLPLDSTVDVEYGYKSAVFLSDGSFEIPDMSPGKYIVRPLIPGFAVPGFIVNLPSSDAEAPHVQTYYVDRLALPTSEPSLPYPLQIVPLGEYNYYTPPPGMNIVQMFKSPMMLMMLFSAVMAIALPKLTSSLEMDPEMAKEFRDQQKAMAKMQSSAMDWSGQLSGMLAAGAAKDEGAGASGSSGSSAPAGAGAARGTPKRGGKRR